AQVTESLEQQTATAEILRVISSSPTEVQPVFDAIVAAGRRLSGGLFSALRVLSGAGVRVGGITPARPLRRRGGRLAVSLAGGGAAAHASRCLCRRHRDRSARRRVP